MRIRATLLFAAVGILLLPFLVSRSQQNELRNSASSAQIAFAGHVLSTGLTGGGQWCECGSGPECICDPGETPENPNPRDQQEDKTDDPNAPSQDPNPGPLALLVVLALLVWRFGR